MEEFIGKTLNRYQIEELLGEGGMGAVYRGHDMTLQRDVAIKVMHAHLSKKPDFQERFLQEARTAARLNHPSIVAVHDFGQAQGMLYIVMEFIPGDNLRRLTQKLRAQNRWLPLTEATGIVSHIAGAIAYAHSAGILHRDIKPANIMLQPTPTNGMPYRPVLTDLGLAKLMEASGLTQEGTAIGTPPYMSPEQTRGEGTDARADVYSLGILLFELALGQLPFPINSLTDAIRFHNHEQPPPPSSMVPDFPKNLEGVILKAIKKSPADRYQDAEELVSALKTWRPTDSSPDISPPPKSEVSLLTLLSPQDPDLEAPPNFPEPTQLADSTRVRIQVLNKEMDSFSVEIPAEGLTIGKSSENQLNLDHPGISDHHARIVVVEEGIQITDLDSTNGTWLGSHKLLPNHPEIWSQGALVHLGEFWMRLVHPGLETPGATTGLMDSGGSRIESDLVDTSPVEGWIAAYLEEKTLETAPGASGQLEIKLLNQGPLVDHLRVSLQGVPETWLQVETADVKLLPGEQSTVFVTISPPQDASSRAGEYPLTIQVSSQNDPNEIVSIKGRLTVGTFARFKASLHPEKITRGQISRVTVENQGNARESFTITWRDRADELTFSPSETVLQVDEGQTTSAEFTPALKKDRLIGNQLSHPFSVAVASSQDEIQKVQGEYVSRGLIPSWVIPVAMVLVVVLASLGGFLYNQGQNRSRQATETAVALQTEAASIAIAQDTDNDGLPDSEEARQGTDPNNPDTDQDGLDDFLEYNSGTDPTDPDTDSDDLKDGEELQLGTNPRLADTDGDTLRDGDEVNQGTNPRLTDTDGDGLPDNVDPAPLMTGTSTPTPTATALPSPTPSLTPTPTPLPDISSGLLAFYPLDGDFSDLSGNGFNLTRYNQANCFSFVDDRSRIIETAAGFGICNNSPDPGYDYGMLYAPHIHFSEEFTLSTWIWHDNYGGDDTWLLGQSNWGGMVLSGRENIGFKLPFWSETPVAYLLDPDATERETWYFYSVVISTDGQDSSVSIYRDGALTASETISGVVFENPSSEEFLVGAPERDDGFDFRGRLDNISVFNRALSPEEIRYLYEQGGDPFSLEKQ